MTGDADMWETVPRLLAANRYLVLGTADAEGDPWVTPVFFAADGVHRLVWVSSPDSRHSRNIAGRTAVAITIFDTHAPIGGAEALYLEATARLVEDAAVAAALSTLNAQLPPEQHLDAGDVGPGAALRMYEATVHQHYVLIRGGDARFDNVTDARLAVQPPAQP